MAHKKAGGSSRNGRDSAGRRLGVKKYGGEPVSYTHRTLPTKRIVEISVVAVSLKKKKKLLTKRMGESDMVTYG